MHEYTEGIMNDGAAILKDGVQMSVSEVIAELNRASALEEALRESILQIEYMHRIFQETGSGNAVLARLKALEATCTK